jgi:hypothetical protein
MGLHWPRSNGYVAQPCTNLSLIAWIGYQMAKNLRTKIPKEDILWVQDVNSAAVNKFVEEMSAYDVMATDSAREVAEESVRIAWCYPFPFT